MSTLFKPNPVSNMINGPTFNSNTNANNFQNSNNIPLQPFLCFPPPSNYIPSNPMGNNTNAISNNTIENTAPIAMDITSLNSMYNIPNSGGNININNNTQYVEHPITSTAHNILPNEMKEKENKKQAINPLNMKELSPKEKFENEINEEYGLKPLI